MKRIIFITGLICILIICAIGSRQAQAAEHDSVMTGYYTFEWEVTLYDNDTWFDCNFSCFYDPEDTGYTIDWDRSHINLLYNDATGNECEERYEMYESDVREENGCYFYDGYLVSTLTNTHALEWVVYTESTDSDGRPVASVFTLRENNGLVWRPTETPTPTVTPVPTNTPVPTVTNTPTPRPTATPRPTNTPVPTATPRPTNTPVPTATPSPTNTPVPTATPTPTSTPTPTPTPAAVLELNVYEDGSELVAEYYTGGCIPVRSSIEYHTKPDENDTGYTGMLNSKTFLSGNGVMREQMEAGYWYAYKLTYVYERDGIQHTEFIWSDWIKYEEDEYSGYFADGSIRDFKDLMNFIWFDLFELPLKAEGFQFSFKSFYMWILIAGVLMVLYWIIVRNR